MRRRVGRDPRRSWLRRCNGEAQRGKIIALPGVNWRRRRLLVICGGTNSVSPISFNVANNDVNQPNRRTHVKLGNNSNTPSTISATTPAPSQEVMLRVGASLRLASHTANTVLAIANANVGIPVNGQSAYRKGEYFQ